jgi:hypothetical protein
MRDLKEVLSLKKFDFEAINYITANYENNKPFELQFTSGSTYIISDNKKGEKIKKSFFAQNLDFSIFSIYKKMKKKLENLDINKEGRERSECRYIDYNSVFEENFNPINENKSLTLNFEKSKTYAIDITQAYPTTALKLGWIDVSDFEKLQKVDKISRLALFGMLATKKYFINFDGQNFSKLEKKTNPLANFFYRLVYEIDQLLINCMNKFIDRSIFFWVDCIFFIGKDKISEIRDFFTQNGYKTTVKQCFYFKKIIENNLVFKYSYINRKRDGILEIKEYTFSNFYKYEKKETMLKKIKQFV